MISNEREFWTVGYSEWGRWQVRKASVDDPYTYRLVEDLGPELKAAYIEADGNFVYQAGLSHITLVTDEIPWLFVITTSGKLYVKRVAEDINNAVLLDTNVEQACVCRGWKSLQYNVDAGLIVVYRKQTGVFLRAYYPVAGTYTWDAVQVVSGQSAQHVEIKRLNDFRLGVLIDNELLITDRYYIGGTAKSEFFNLIPDDEFRVLSLTQPSGEHADFEVVSVELKDNIEFWVRGNYPFYSMDTRWSDLSITTTVASGQGIDRYWIEDGYLKIRMLQPILSALAYMSFRIREVNRIRFIRTPQSKPICPQTDIIYQAPPQPYQETFRPVFTSTMQIQFKQPTVHQNSYEEHFFPVMANTLTLQMLEVGNLSAAYEETFSIEFTSQMSQIVMEQVGDKPI